MTKKNVILLFVLFLGACGKDESINVVRSLNLILQFPVALSKSSGHFEAFVKKVEFLKIIVKTNSQRKEYYFPPAKWETLFISDLPKAQPLEISVEVWDRREDGFRRAFPILIGKKSFTQKDLEGNDTLSHRIVLHAEGSIRF